MLIKFLTILEGNLPLSQHDYFSIVWHKAVKITQLLTRSTIIVQSSLSSLDRVHNCLHDLVGCNLFSTPTASFHQTRSKAYHYFYSKCSNELHLAWSALTFTTKLCLAMSKELNCPYLLRLSLLRAFHSESLRTTTL